MKSKNKQHRRLPVGAEARKREGVHFRVWAPEAKKVEVVTSNGAVPLILEDEGYHSGTVPSASTGTLYKYRLNGREEFPDPAARFQPEGPHGPSQVVDPGLFTWSDQEWKGVRLQGQIIYEMHVGTFTREGTWRSAVRELPALAHAGITVLEVMPVNEFPGRFGWGYDGVSLFAPTRLYGAPDDFRMFVNMAHSLGMGVILDVVYNHLGPDGNYLAQYSKDYFNQRNRTDWGDAINFDERNSGPVREFFLSNAGYWISEFHLDGLRMDATQNIYDDSKDHILAAICREVREAAEGRSTIIVGENEPQDPALMRSPEEGGYGLDGLWNDDFHHSAIVALSGHNDAYYTDYLGSPQEFVSAAKYGFLYQGQYYKWQKKRRGSPAFGVHPAAFITFIQNHDQVANSARGERCHKLTSPGLYRAMTALMLLGPGTPMLFQGQEFAASTPFYFFADQKNEIAELIREGRKEFLGQWRSLKLPEMQCCFADPADVETFEKSKLDHSEREKHKEVFALHRDLIHLRREDPVFRAQRPGGVDGAVLSQHAFVLRFFDEADGDRILIVNFGLDLHLNPSPEPLLAPAKGGNWRKFFSTEDPEYGGYGTPPLDTPEGWRIPGQAAVALKPASKKEKEKTDG